MAETKKLRFLTRCGIGGMYFAAGATADVPERQAAYFVNTGQAEYVESETPAEPPSPAKPAAKAKPKGKGK